MIARVWQGCAPTSNASRHAANLRQKLLHTHLGLPGDRGALLLARNQIGGAAFLAWGCSFLCEHCGAVLK